MRKVPGKSRQQSIETWQHSFFQPTSEQTRRRYIQPDPGVQQDRVKLRLQLRRVETVIRIVQLASS